MITPTYFTLAMVLMAFITFMTRYVFFMQTISIRLHPQIKKLLVFTAPCILTAMTVPIMFQDTLVASNTGTLWHSSYFWAGILAIVFSFTIRHTLWVIILSVGGFYILRYLGLQ